MPFGASSSRQAKKVVKRPSQKGQKTKVNEDINEPKLSASSKPVNTKSLQEMKAFIAQMQQKYNPSGGYKTAAAAEVEEGQILKNTTKSFTDDSIQSLLHSNTAFPNTISSEELSKYLIVSACSNKGSATASPLPTLAGEQQQQQQEQGERTQVDRFDDPSTRHIIGTNACTCCCAEVAEEAASLKVLVAEMQRQHAELRKDLEEYAATTGAMLASMHGQLKRCSNSGGGGID